MRYHFFPNFFEKSIKIEKRKSPLYDQTLATVIHCIWKSLFINLSLHCKCLDCLSTIFTYKNICLFSATYQILIVISIKEYTLLKISDIFSMFVNTARSHCKICMKFWEGRKIVEGYSGGQKIHYKYCFLKQKCQL